LAACIRRGPLPVDEALAYATEIADALDKAHRQGIVHRDLKPVNVMLVKASSAARASSDGGRQGASIAKLLDFGLAKLAPSPSIATLETDGPAG
ncbi:MAG TPA: protein kinase, partial [Candidatus Sulfotelmatobacter sp.]|nr:protein kinase [Candidatus Sulfotelmatobacter sp.]